MVEEENIELSDLWYNKGLKFLESKEYENANSAFDRALKYNNKDARVWNIKCHDLNKIGNYEDAVKVGNTAVQKIPDNIELWDNLTDAYIGCKNQEKADKCQKNVLHLKKSAEMKAEMERYIAGLDKIYNDRYSSDFLFSDIMVEVRDDMNLNQVKINSCTSRSVIKRQYLVKSWR